MQTERKTPGLDELRALIAKDSTVILGLSGGPDSMYLLHLLMLIKDEFRLKVIAAHIDHNIRKNSVKDADFCEKTTRKLGLIFEKKVLSFTSQQNFEARARHERYVFFDELKAKYKAQTVLTAHNLNDVLETQLYHYIKGSGLRGLTGIRTNDKYTRPLLNVSKPEILKYLKKHHLIYRVDESNNDTKYARNYLRHTVIPMLRTLNPALEAGSQRYSEYFTTLNSYFEELSATFLTQHFKKNTLSIATFQKLHIAVQREVLTHLYKKLNTNEKPNANIEGLTFTEIERLRLLIVKNKHTDGRFGKASYTIEYGNIIFGEIPANKMHVKFSILKKKPQELVSKNHIVLGVDKSCTLGDFTADTWHAGDTIMPLGMNGKYKKLSDIFTDKKIKKNLRNSIPIIKIRGEIACIGTQMISEKFKVSDKTSRYIKVTLDVQ